MEIERKYLISSVPFALSSYPCRKIEQGYLSTAPVVRILLPFMVMPLYSSIEKLDKPLLEAAKDLGASKFQTFIRIIIPLTMPGIIAGCLLVMLPAMGLFYVSDLMGGAKNLLIGNVIKSQFLNIRDWPFGSATSITLTVVMGLMLLVYWRASRLLNKKVELE